jgi:hypothetical protein
MPQIKMEDARALWDRPWVSSEMCERNWAATCSNHTGMARDDTWFAVLQRPGWVEGSDDVLETQTTLLRDSTGTHQQERERSMLCGTTTPTETIPRALHASGGRVSSHRGRGHMIDVQICQRDNVLSVKPTLLRSNDHLYKYKYMWHQLLITHDA